MRTSAGARRSAVVASGRGPAISFGGSGNCPRKPPHAIADDLKHDEFPQILGVKARGIDDMVTYFNAPPNWPVADDFEPGPDWYPPPEWGGPPTDWPLWIDDEGREVRGPTFGFGTSRAPTRARVPVPTDPLVPIRRALMTLVLVLDGVAVVAEGQQVSLVTGLGILYVGVALAVGASLIASALKASVMVQILTLLVAIGCIAWVVYANQKLTDQRHQLRDDLNGISTSLQH